jgi:hypothetical protein
MAFGQKYKYEGAVPTSTGLAPAHHYHHYLDLLTDRVDYPGWNVPRAGTADKLAFYILGVSWYKDNVQRYTKINFSDCGPYIDRAMEILAGRRHWHDGQFDWSDRIAPQQVWKAVSPSKRSPIKFQKAVVALAVLEAMAEGPIGFVPPAGYQGPDVLSNCRIQPAVSYITDLEKGDLANRDDDFFERLKKATGQRHRAVFIDMADKKPVTHGLATHTRDFLRNAGIWVGNVEDRYDRLVKYPPSVHEEIDY